VFAADSQCAGITEDASIQTNCAAAYDLRGNPCCYVAITSGTDNAVAFNAGYDAGSNVQKFCVGIRDTDTVVVTGAAGTLVTAKLGALGEGNTITTTEITNAVGVIAGTLTTFTCGSLVHA